MQSGALEIACIAHVPWLPYHEIFLHKRCAFVKEGRKAEWWPTRHGRGAGRNAQSLDDWREAIKSVAKRRKTA